LLSFIFKTVRLIKTTKALVPPRFGGFSFLRILPLGPFSHKKKSAIVLSLPYLDRDLRTIII